MDAIAYLEMRIETVVHRNQASVQCLIFKWDEEMWVCLSHHFHGEAMCYSKTTDVSQGLPSSYSLLKGNLNQVCL